MGHVIKKILGNRDDDPFYEEFTIEVNESVTHRKVHGIRNYPGEVHFHAKNLRFDLKWKDYKILRDACIEANRDIKKKEVNYIDEKDKDGFTFGLNEFSKVSFSSKDGNQGYVNVPIFPGDRIDSQIVGKNVQAYRIVENAGVRYFDSIVPLKGFRLRRESPRRFLDIMSLSRDKIDKLLSLSADPENYLVEINAIKTDFSNYLIVRMPFLKGLPIVPESSAIKISDEACAHAGKIYNAIISSEFKEISQRIYDSFIKINRMLIQEVGVYLTDIAPNNVVVSIEHVPKSKELIIDLRFVDILDIKYYTEPFSVDMSRLFSITRDRLPKSFTDQLNQESLSLLPTLSDLNDDFRKSIYELKIDSFFNMINRNRYQTFQRKVNSEK